MSSSLSLFIMVPLPVAETHASRANSYDTVVKQILHEERWLRSGGQTLLGGQVRVVRLDRFRSDVPLRLGNLHSCSRRGWRRRARERDRDGLRREKLACIDEANGSQFLPRSQPLSSRYRDLRCNSGKNGWMRSKVAVHSRA